MKHLILSLLLSLSGYGLPGQQTGDSLYFVLPTDTMLVENDAASGHIRFEHYLAPGQTLFGASKFYGLKLADVYIMNPNLRSKYEAGDKVKVPLPPRVIRAAPAPDSLAWFIPVYYKMARGETIFGLYKRTLKLDSDERLRTLNPGLDPAALPANAVLHVGYFKIDGIPAEYHAEIEDPYVRRNRGLRERWENKTRGKKMKQQNGKAAWTRKGDRSKWMALHRTAPIGSLIEIDDPRSRKVLYARVVGRIPGQVYPPDVIVVVSPLLLKAFGVRDKRFYVRTRHF